MSIKQHGNRHSSGLTLTDREALTIERMHRKLKKMSRKKNRYIMEKIEMERMVEMMDKMIREAGRGYILDGENE